MASRTQMRLQQLTGSVVDIKNQTLAATSNNNFAKGAASELTGSSNLDLFGYLAASLNRIHGAASSEPFNNTASTLGDGTNPRITYSDGAGIVLNQENGAAAALTIGSSDPTNKLVTFGGNAKFSNAANIGSTGTEDLITLNASDVQIKAGQTLKVDTITESDTDVGVAIEGALIQDGNITIVDSKAINIGADSDVTITHNGTTGATLASAGAFVIDGAAAVTVDSEAALTLGGATLDVDADGGAVDIDASTNVVLGGTNALEVQLGRATKDVVVLGNLQVRGTTTTVSSSQTVFEDSIIGLGFSGSGGDSTHYNNLGDRGIIFGVAAGSGAKLPALRFNRAVGNFEFIKSTTNPLSGAFTGAEAASLDVENVSAIGQVTANNGIRIQDTGNDHFLTIDLNEDLSANRTLNLVTGDGNRSLTIEGDSLINQDLTSDSTAAAFGVLTLSTRLDPSANGGVDLGTTTVGFGDIHIADDKAIKFGDDQDSSIEYDENGDNVLQIAGANVRIGHNANTALEFRDSAISIASLNDGFMDLTADTGVRVTSNELIVGDGTNGVGKIKLRESHAGQDGSVAIDCPAEVAGDLVYTLPGVIVNGGFLQTNSTGDLSFVDVGLSTQKAIRVIGATVNAGTGVSTAAADIQGGVEVDGLLTSATNQGKNLEVYVNGQLMASGSQAQRTANPPTRDYEISGAKEIKFAFNLEAEDIVQVIKR